MSHTPGPWRATLATLDGDWAVEAASVIAEVPNTTGSAFDGEAEANAHLIAAAPDLLAAVIAAYHLIGDDYRETDLEKGVTVEAVAEPAWHLICEALAKAEVEP